MEEWKIYKLKEIGEIVGGATPSTKNPSNYDGPIPWITPKDLSNSNERYIFNGERSITNDGYMSCSCKLLPKGTVLFSSRAPIGYVAIAAVPMCTNQGFKSFIPNSKVDSLFMFYLMKYRKDDIANLGSGTTFIEVSGSVMKEFEVKVPNLDTQKRIANVLSSLDDKIELNNRINHNLEEQAQALYKSWFIDFEPFKDGKFVESELGMIPEGWRVLPAESICPINIGKTPPRSEHTWFSSDKQNITWVSISDMGNAGCFINSSAETLTKEAVEKFNIKVVPPGSILLSFKLTIGRVAIAGKELTSNEAIARFEASDYQRSFLFLTLKSYDYSSLGSTSSIATAVNSKIIKSMPIICPTDKIMTDFHFLTKDIFTEIQIRQEETSRLSEIRDSLLPKLMSGELKINEIDC